MAVADHWVIQRSLRPLTKHDGMTDASSKVLRTAGRLRHPPLSAGARLQDWSVPRLTEGMRCG